MPLYDCNDNRVLRRDELPADIKPAVLIRFLRAAGYRFHSLTYKGDPVLGGEGFRVGTGEFPSRGLDVPYDAVRRWAADMEKRDVQEAQAICRELPMIQQRALAAGLHQTHRALIEAIQTVGYEAAALIEFKTAKETADEG